MAMSKWQITRESMNRAFTKKSKGDKLDSFLTMMYERFKPRVSTKGKLARVARNSIVESTQRLHRELAEQKRARKAGKRQSIFANPLRNS